MPGARAVTSTTELVVENLEDDLEENVSSSGQHEMTAIQDLPRLDDSTFMVEDPVLAISGFVISDTSLGTIN